MVSNEPDEYCLGSIVNFHNHPRPIAFYIKYNSIRGKYIDETKLFQDSIR
jgi:hypothetical protein